MAVVKQIVAVRRRAGMTRSEYFDYHFQVHGKLTEGPTSEMTCRKYYQTHVFDSAYNGPDLHQHSWAQHDNIVELYFNDTSHLASFYGSDWVREKFGTDTPNFSDTSAVIAMFVKEETLHAPNNESVTPPDHQEIVANLFLQFKQGVVNGNAAEQVGRLNPIVVKAFEGCSQKIVANASTEDELHLLGYFQGTGPAVFHAAFTFLLRSYEDVKAFRLAQKTFEESAKELIVRDTTFVCFGIRALVLDQTRGVRFDGNRQPRLPKPSPA